jgi:hypothetical protein
VLRRVRILPMQHCESYKAWGYNWDNLSIGDINAETWSSKLGVDARLKSLLCRKITVAKFRFLKTGCNLAGSSKEACGTKSAVLPMMMIMIVLKL